MTTAALGPQALGALVGGLVVVGFFGFGTLTMSLVAKVAPAASLLVALLTYTLQVLLLGVLLWTLTASTVVPDRVDPQWLGGAVLAGTLAWTVILVVRAVRARLPVYDLPVPEEAARR